jgi:dipeptidyl aminopeptidase/acylaminoacyl peptidase
VYRFGGGDVGLINAQLLATRGYAVLIPDLPQDVGTPVRDIVQGVHAAVNKAIDVGIVDSERLGVFGHSYGGYGALAITTQTDRFRAAVVAAGISDLVARYLRLRTTSDREDGISWAERGQGLMGGSLWDYRDRYIENSPIMFLDRVHTPILIVHGELDAGLPASMADEVFVGLKRLGREVEYRRYLNEGHGLSRTDNILDYWSALIRWFDHYVMCSETK